MARVPAHDPRSRSALRGVGYQQGQAALSPTVQLKEEPDPAAAEAAAAAEKEAERKAACKRSYEQLLGKFLGGPLYDVVAKELSADKILEYGGQGMDAAIDGTTGLIKPIDGAGGAMDEQSEADAVKAFAKALAGWARTEGDNYLKSDDGKALRTKIGQWFEGHPGVVVALALAAAAGAYAANADIPEIKKKFKLGGGTALEVGVDPGTLQNITLAGARATLSHKSGDVSASLTYKYEAGDVDKHSVSGKVQDNSGRVLSGTLTRQGDSLVIDTSAGITTDGGSASVGVKHTEDAEKKATLGTAKIKLGDADHWIGADASMDFGTGQLRIGTSTFDRLSDEFSLRTSTSSTDEKGATQTIGLAYEDKKKHLKFTLDHEVSELQGQSASLTGEKKHMIDEDWYLSGNFRLTDERLESVGAQFGYRDKDEFSAFLIDYKHQFKPDGMSEDQFGLLVEQSVGNIMVRAQNRTTLLTGRGYQSSVTQLHAGYKLSTDWTVIGGARYGHQSDLGSLSDRDRGAWLESGVQYKGVPLVLGYRPEDNSFSFGITIPFGR